MSRIKKAWHFLLANGFLWIFYCIFQPSIFNSNFKQVIKSFERDFGQATFLQQARQTLKLTLPFFLSIYLSIYLLLFFGGVGRNFGTLVSFFSEEWFIKEGES